jgi:hypothetical protein
VIAEHFLPRARTLQARTALTALRALAHHIADSHPNVSQSIDNEAERIEASAIDFARLRAAHLLATSQLRLNDAERFELRHILLGKSVTASLGLPDEANIAAIQQSAIETIDKLRKRAGHPLADPVVVEVCEAAARTCEAIYIAAAG